MTTKASTAELVAPRRRIDGPAEIVGRGDRPDVSDRRSPEQRGRGDLPKPVGLRATHETGRAYADNTGLVVDLPHRKSFSPDASFYVGAPPGTNFLEGGANFAAEVRSEDDYGPAAERGMAGRSAPTTSRPEPKSCGTSTFSARGWSGPSCRTEGDTKRVFRRGELGRAPALPGWILPIERQSPVAGRAHFRSRR